MNDGLRFPSSFNGFTIAMADAVPDEIFLLAFDKAIEQVCRRLTSSGLADEAIWAGFRKATIAMGRLALDVDDERLARRVLKASVRTRRSGARSCGKGHSMSRSGSRRSKD